MAKKIKKSKRKIVGYPLTPILLQDLKAFDEFQHSPKKFKPDKDWEHLYLIWTCHGYRRTSNDGNGFLRIKKTNGGSAKSFLLKITQKIAHDEGALHIIDAEIRCQNNPLASPVEWNLSSRFIGPDKKERPELEMKEEGIIKGDNVEIKSNKRSFKRKGSGWLTGDWCLFEAIQRMPFKNGTRHMFDVMEGMSLLKEDHRLSYRGLYPIEVSESNNKKISLQWFQQLGHGVLPYEYWLDSNHRLVIAVTGPRAYILDEHAEEKVSEYEKSGRMRFRKQQGKYNGRK